MNNPLVSIIIPNYNEEKFISLTIESAINQDYDNKEIIIVDDGSTDSSYEIIEKYSSCYDYITAIRQENANASIARNRGIEHAKGKYFYFLDSDDIVESGAIRKMVKMLENTEADIAIGNMREIDSQGEEIKKDTFFDTDGVSEDFKLFFNVLPAPPNKLFRASLIMDKNIRFGNVRIGQDTNFYLKYLLCCSKIAYSSDIMYGWRIVNSSMTHAMDFHIFDIVNSFKNIKAFYIFNEAEAIYEDYIRMIEFHTYYRQMDKQRKFETHQERMLVINYFDYYIKRLGNLRNCKNFSEFESSYKKCLVKQKAKLLYGSSLFKIFYKMKNRGYIDVKAERQRR